MSKTVLLTLLLVLGLLLAGVVVALNLLPGGDAPATGAALPAAGEGAGTLTFTANGEDFIRQGFTSKDGWAVRFDRVLVNLVNIAAYQTSPPYQPDVNQGSLAAAQAVQLPGPYVVDLAAGDENAPPIIVTEKTVAPGRYNALGWQMTPATGGEMAGYSLLMEGVAQKDSQTVQFSIGIDESYNNLCGEFVGDARKGILQPNSAADLEMTFHFDHIFGDGTLPATDSLNELSPGFAPFASLAQDGQLTTNLSALVAALPPAEADRLVSILPTLGHTGEGHCHYGEQSVTIGP